MNNAINVTMKITGDLSTSNYTLAIIPFPGLLIKKLNGEEFRVLRVTTIAINPSYNYLEQDPFGNAISIEVERII